MQTNIMQSKTNNGMNAWAISQLAEDIQVDPKVKQIISILGELWSSVSSNTTDIVVLTTKIQEYFKLINELELEQDKKNFETMMMLYCIYLRDRIDGSGLKDASRTILVEIIKNIPENQNLIKLVLTFYKEAGYWKCLTQKLLQLNLEDKELIEKIERSVFDLMREQLNKDLDIISQLEKLTDEDPTQKTEMKKNLSNLGKWLPRPRGAGKKRRKANKPTINLNKVRTELCIKVASNLIDTQKNNLKPYNIGDVYYLDNKKYTVTEKTPLFNIHYKLLKSYDELLKKLRKYIPIVEHNMHKNGFKHINFNAITGQNSLKYDHAFKNKKPKFLTESTIASRKMGKKNVEKMKAKYGETNRYETEDRIVCSEKKTEHETQIKLKAELKEKQLEESRSDINTIKTRIDNLELLGVFSGEEYDELKKKYDEMTQKYEKIKEQKIINNSAGNPVEVYLSYKSSDSVNTTYEMLIKEMILGSMADLSNIGFIPIADNSGSMDSGGNDIAQPIDVCIAMTAFMAMSAQGNNKHWFVHFSENPFWVDMKKWTLEKYGRDEQLFFDYIKYMKSNQINAGSTNFEGVVELLKQMFANSDPKTLPKYLVFFSDMQFDQAVKQTNKDLSASAIIKKGYDEIGIPEQYHPKIIFWNLTSYGNRPAMLSDNGAVMLSGYNPKMLLQLNEIVETAKSQQEVVGKEELLVQINTWTTINQTLMGTKLNNDLLVKLKEHNGHTLI